MRSYLVRMWRHRSYCDDLFRDRRERGEEEVAETGSLMVLRVLGFAEAERMEVIDDETGNLEKRIGEDLLKGTVYKI